MGRDPFCLGPWRKEDGSIQRLKNLGENFVLLSSWTGILR